MPRTEEQNRVIRDKRKAKITEMGIKLMAAYGPAEIAVDDIATAIDCSHGLFYHYFKNTEELYAYIPTYVQLAPKLQAYRIPFERIEDAGGAEGLKILAEYVSEIGNAPDLVIAILTLYVGDLSFFTTPAGVPLSEALLKLVTDGQKEGKVVDGNPVDIIDLFLDFAQGCLTRRDIVGRKDFVGIPADLIAHLFLK